ncbi:MAG: transporter substrate-binding domain-containing protein [Xanthobacteraceae bacterium]
MPICKLPALPVLIAAVLASAQLAVATAEAQQSGDPRIAELTQAGKIRVGLFPPQYVKDSATREIRSAWVEIARALARRMGLEAVMLERRTPPEAVACLKSADCDLLFLPFDERAAEVGDFSHPILQFEYTLLVPTGSRVRKIADADQPGTRIAAVRNHGSTMTLIPLLKHATLTYAETPKPTFDLLQSAQADVMASTRNALLEFSDQLPGSRVLEDHYGANINRMVVPKGKAGWLAYVNEFVEEAKASGLVQKAIDRVGPRGLTVPAPGDAK